MPSASPWEGELGFEPESANAKFHLTYNSEIGKNLMFKCLPCQTGSSKIESGPETLKNCSLLSENAN